MTVTFTQLTESMSRNNDAWNVTISDNWMQGRTTYGGLSAALCLRAVINQHSELPPLRSAQVNFIGPAGGDVSITSKILRQGKSVAYISAEMTSEKGLATNAVFCFGASRKSQLNNAFLTPPEIPDPTDSKEFFLDGPRPAFTHNYEVKLAAGDPPFSGSSNSEFHLWCRHKDQQAKDIVALLGIADMPPPAVLPMFRELAPISSMTWMLDFSTDQISTENGWWLLRQAAEHAKDGYTSQNMRVWNSSGDLVISGRQNIAIFY